MFYLFLSSCIHLLILLIYIFCIIIIFAKLIVNKIVVTII